MNSYNDNLNSVVAATLQAQELENKDLNAQRIAAMFTLYHAEGATITANEKLQADQLILEDKGEVQTQAVACSNISTNLLASATQASTFVAQSVTNTSVAAANTQVAGNAILQLAGDMGNVFSIVNAADFDTEIYKQGKEAMELINETAYLAEVATQTAMNASIATSEVSSATVLNKAKATNTLMTNLLQIVQADFNTASQTVAADTTNVAAASVNEKIAEGNYEDIVADYKAGRTVYKTANTDLNLGLGVKPVERRDANGKLLPSEPQDVSTRNIQFNLVTSPFAPKITDPLPADFQITPDIDPVSDYYILLVKETEKTTFSMTEAEAMILKAPGNYIQIEVTPSQIVPKTGSKTEKTLTPAVYTRVDTNEPVLVHGGRLHLTVDLYDVNGSKMLDADGDQIVMGQKYVVFVLAVYTSNYKRKLNDFEDFLSATSNTFKLAYILKPVYDMNVGTIAEIDPANTATTPPYDPAEWFDMENATHNAETKTDPDTHEIQFSVSENSSYASEVEYRCIILPAGDQVVSGLLTRASMHDLESEVEALENIADKYDPLIVSTHDALLTARLELARINFVPECQVTNPPTTSMKQDSYNAAFNKLNDQLIAAPTKADADKIAAEIKKMSLEFKKISFIPSYQNTTPRTTSTEQADMNKEFDETQSQLDAALASGNTAAIDKATKAVNDLRASYKKIGFTPSFQVTNPVSTVKEEAQYNAECDALNNAYVAALTAKQTALAQTEQKTVDSFSFLFNLRLAEQVTAGNYFTPVKYRVRNDVPGHQWPVIDYIAHFGPGTTDNFGTPLISGNEYTFVVLSLSSAEEQNLSRFVNTWAVPKSADVVPFTYIEPVVVPLATLEPTASGSETGSGKVKSAAKSATKKSNKNKRK